jgi:hypothetical protein
MGRKKMRRSWDPLEIDSKWQAGKMKGDVFRIQDICSVVKECKGFLTVCQCFAAQ